jgi:hypothetical protein
MNWPGRVVLLVAICVSLFRFCRKFGAALRIIRASKPDADFQLRPILPRLRRVLWEVAAQGLVIAQRPLPGLGPCLCLLGLLRFCLGDHQPFRRRIGRGLPVGWRIRAGVYFPIAAVFAVAVSDFDRRLAFRRFVMRPKWLEPLVAGIGPDRVLDFRADDHVPWPLLGVEGSAAAWAVWWAHTLVLLVFLPLIPGTKHMHLVLSPVTVFLERDGFSKIPPLVGDEDFGLDTGKDLTRIAMRCRLIAAWNADGAPSIVRRTTPESF